MASSNLNEPGPTHSQITTGSGLSSSSPSSADEGGGAAGSFGETAVDSNRKRLFSKELRHMMFGLGDDQNPYTESVDLIEDLVVEYITEITQNAMNIGKTGRVGVEEVIHLIRKDTKKYARVKDLLTMNEELKKARKAFDEVKYATGV